MSPEERAAINRQNAQKSTGPRTEEGKAASRQNSTKHGLTGKGIVQSDEDAVSLEAKLEHYVATAQPTTLYEFEFLRRMAIASVRLERSFQAEEGRRKLRRSRVTKRFQNMLKRSADAAREVWAEKTAVGHQQLVSTSAGCRWLIGEWRALEQKIKFGGCWNHNELKYALTLAGIDTRASMPQHQDTLNVRIWSLSLRASWTADEGDKTLMTFTEHEDNATRIDKQRKMLIPTSQARSNLVKYIGTEIAQLEEREAMLTREVEGPDLNTRLEAAEVDTSPDGLRYARYDAMNEAAMHKNWNAFVRVRTLGESKLGLVPEKDLEQNEAIEEKTTPSEEHTCASSPEGTDSPATVSEGVLRVMSDPEEEAVNAAGPPSSGPEPPPTPSKGV